MRDSRHGHVYPRSDGIRARCGGPRICPDCARDQIEKDRDNPPTEKVFVPLGIILGEEYGRLKGRKT